MSQSENWLIQEDTLCFADRAACLDWIAEITPAADYLTFPGGFMAKYLFEEARYCFVYGQFLAMSVFTGDTAESHPSGGPAASQG